MMSKTADSDAAAQALSAASPQPDFAADIAAETSTKNNHTDALATELTPEGAGSSVILEVASDVTVPEDTAAAPVTEPTAQNMADGEAALQVLPSATSPPDTGADNALETAPKTHAATHDAEVTPEVSGSPGAREVAPVDATSGQSVISDAAHSDMDMEPLLQLLEKPPGEVAAWMLDQVKDLGEADSLVESLPIFKVAGALKAAPVEQKQALISSMMQGVGDLSVEQRTQALRLVSHLPNAASPGELETNAASSAGASAPVLSTNFARIVQEAAFADMPPDELQKIGQLFEKEQGQLVTPLLAAMPELNEDERNHMTEALVAKGIVSEENRTLLQDTVKPGGHADNLGNLLKGMALAYRYTWIIWALPVLEIALVLLLLSPFSTCSMPLLPWLIGDALIAVGIAAAAYSLKHVLKSSYQEFSDNPLKMVTRVQTAIAEGTQFADAVPGAGPAKYLVSATVLLVVIGACWAVDGLFKAFATITSPCPLVPRLTAVLLCCPIMKSRILLLAVSVFYAIKGVRMVRELRGQTSASAPLMSDPSPNYGAAEPELQV